MNCGRLPTTVSTFIRGYTNQPLGPLAQLVEQGTLNPKVEGSIPSRPTSCCKRARAKPAPARRQELRGHVQDMPTARPLKEAASPPHHFAGKRGRDPAGGTS